MLRRVVQRYREATRRFGASKGGSIVLVWALAMLVVISAAGGAVDYGRAVNTRGLIAAELDAAALAGARYLSTAKDVDKAKLLIKESFAQTAGVKLAAIADVDEVDPDIDNANGVIKVTAQATVKTAFVQLLGIRTIPVSVATEVRFGSKYVEVALVLDVTGSMRNDMDTLRTAAQSLVDDLIPLGTSISESKVRISLVPYSQGVNAGLYASTVSDGDAGASNCVTEREGDEKYTDATYNYDGADSWFFGGGSGEKRDTACSSTSLLVPLTSDNAVLTAGITALDDDGYTAGQTGVAWGWYTLSPNWSNLWPTASAPGAYTDNDVLKYIVFMTDGDFNTYYDYVGAGTANNSDKNSSSKPTCPSGLAGLLQYLQGKCVPAGSDSGNSGGNGKNGKWKEKDEKESATNVSSTRAKDLCTAAKAKGVTVFSIYFGKAPETDPNTGVVSELAPGGKVMQACASDVATTYYYASNAANLISAFQAISTKIKGIYLSK